MKSFNSALDQPIANMGRRGFGLDRKAMLLEAQQAAPPWSGSFFSQSPPSGESRVWLEARQFVLKNCSPDRLCAARLKARQFVIKITNHRVLGSLQ
jgi:hypothetical protein